MSIPTLIAVVLSVLLLAGGQLWLRRNRGDDARTAAGFGIQGLGALLLGGAVILDGTSIYLTVAIAAAALVLVAVLVWRAGQAAQHRRTDGNTQ
ncbi:MULTISPECIES: hypothetical protein [Rhodococcus]|uniref:hypothetical protein n=1 Tax=Rhodococcus TaxID=1827 RepID=UPI002226A534|nr:hypothetical protein [Rhodococcus pyridinivorans]MCW3471865.1 hypothetical protein [Rhodococcus pyridinivorans]